MTGSGAFVGLGGMGASGFMGDPFCSVVEDIRDGFFGGFGSGGGMGGGGTFPVFQFTDPFDLFRQTFGADFYTIGCCRPRPECSSNRRRLFVLILLG